MKTGLAMARMMDSGGTILDELCTREVHPFGICRLSVGGDSVLCAICGV